MMIMNKDSTQGWSSDRAIWRVVFILVLLLCRGQEVCAASADVTVFTRAEDIYVGDTFYVMITVASEMPVSDVELTVPIDSKMLKFTTGGDVASATKSKVTITDIGSDSAEFSKIYALGFEAKKKGDFVFHIESPFAVYAYDAASDSRIPLSVSANELPVTILKKGAKASASPPSSSDPGAFVSPQGTGPFGEPSVPDASTEPITDGQQTEKAPVPDASPDGVMDGQQDGMGEPGAPAESGMSDITVPDASSVPEASVSPQPSSQGKAAYESSIWTNILIGVIVIIIIGALAAAGYFIIKLLH